MQLMKEKLKNNPTDISQIAEQLIKQYRDIPSLDKSQKQLEARYGSATFPKIRQRFAELWLKQNGIEIIHKEIIATSELSAKDTKAVKKKKKKAKTSGWKSTMVVKKDVVAATPKAKPVAISCPNVPVPKIMRDVRGTRVVTTNVDPESNMPPVYVTLPVIRTTPFGGKLCYVVKYGPNGVEPYEWHVPVVDSLYESLEEIPCVYHQHILLFDDKDPGLKMIKRQPVRLGTKRTFTAVKRTTAPKIVSTGSSVSKMKSISSINQKPNPAPLPMPFYRKSPEQWHAEVGSDAKHKCGKPFVCNCCGGNFSKNQGYRVNFKEIYFCFECSKKIYKPSHRGWRGTIISIPMGNKR